MPIQNLAQTLKITCKKCFLLSLPYLTPSQRTSRCWVCAYDYTNKILPMVDALYVLYYSWVPKADTHLYKDEWVVHRTLSN